MPKSLLTQENIEFIKAHRFEMSGSAMAKIFGVEKSVVNRYMRRNGLTVPRELKLKFRIDAMKGRTSSIPEWDEQLRNEYLTVTIADFARRFNKSETFVSIRLRQLGLILPKEVIEQRMKDSLIKKGSVPPNKGKKQSEYMSPEAIARTTKTRFQKGLVPHNTAAEGDGAIRTRWHKRDNCGYKYVRLSAGKWELLHRVVWEKHNGEIPDKHVIAFLDGNTLNCNISNLELISMQENMNRNRDYESDKTIARYMATSSRKLDKNLQRQLMQQPELLEVKRLQLKLQKEIKNATQSAH